MILASMGYVMNRGRYFELIILGCVLGTCLNAVENNNDWIEMNPLLGPSKAPWTIVYEPKILKEPSELDDLWLNQMEEEEKLDRIFPKYRGMSSYPNYTAMSKSPAVLGFLPPEEDEEGVVIFVKNRNTQDQQQIVCLDIVKHCPFIGCCVRRLISKFFNQEKKQEKYEI